MLNQSVGGALHSTHTMYTIFISTIFTIYVNHISSERKVHGIFYGANIFKHRRQNEREWEWKIDKWMWYYSLWYIALTMNRPNVYSTFNEWYRMFSKCDTYTKCYPSECRANCEQFDAQRTWNIPCHYYFTRIFHASHTNVQSSIWRQKYWTRALGGGQQFDEVNDNELKWWT